MITKRQQFAWLPRVNDDVFVFISWASTTGVGYMAIRHMFLGAWRLDMMKRGLQRRFFFHFLKKWCRNLESRVNPPETKWTVSPTCRRDTPI